MEDFPGLDQTMAPVLDALNRVLEELSDALKGRVSFGQNINGVFVQKDLTHNVELEFEISGLRGKPIAAYLSAPTAGQLQWSAVGDTSVRVTAVFEGAPSDPVTSTILFIGE